MSLHIHRASAAEHLLDGLLDVLVKAGRASDPFEPLVVSVPTRGIERWITEELSTRLGNGSGRTDGIAANIAFPFPSTVINWATGAVDGLRADPHQLGPSESSPWAPDRLAWTLLDVLDATDDVATEFGAFGAHVSGEFGKYRRLAAVRKVARMFNRYASDRPWMLQAWAADRDVDGTGQSLNLNAAWQPNLWRAARSVLGPAPVERMDAIVEHLRTHGVDGLPNTGCVYGLTALPPAHAPVLTALAAHHDLHLFLLHPSPALWSTLSTATVDASTLRAADPTVTTPANPLLASWARDSRELQLVLGTAGEDCLHDPAAVEPHTLLQRLQRDIRTDTDPAASIPIAADATVQVHGCHGQIRQVEVLRDVILGLMTDDPSIQPRDIAVMCPDIETFAPLIQAVFGGRAGASNDGLPDLRVRLADRSPRHINPYLRTVADILDLPDGRFEASAALDLLRQAPVMARFGLDEDQVETISGWIDDVGIRWGLDADHRAIFGLDTDANTWEVGLKRLLLGVAVPEDGPRMVGGVLPHDDIEGTVVWVAGQFAEFVDRIGLVATHLRDPRPIGEWITDLRATADLLCAANGPYAWQQVQFGQLLLDLGDQADDSQIALTLPEVRGLLTDLLRPRPTIANHRTGDLTVCSLVPMRSVPFRVICLLGLDDDAFPRRSVPFGDDLIARDPHVGDHDPRTEDRQLLLDAVMAARDHLVVLYRSHDERTGAELPPAVPIAELLDVIDATATRTPDGQPARNVVVRHHPLHGADPRAFDPEAPFGFDPLALAGAAARQQPPVPATSFNDQLPHPIPLPPTVAWSDLVRFLTNPVGTYLGERLEVRFPREESGPADLLTVTMNGLEQWQVGTRLLTGALRENVEEWADAERARGLLPPGELGTAALATLEETRQHILDALDRDGIPLADLIDVETARVPIDLAVDGITLTGAVESVGRDLLVRIDYGKPKPKRLLKAWLDWLILQASGSPRPALLITSGINAGVRRGQEEVLTRYPDDIGQDEACRRLAVLVDLYRRGLASPLPLFESTSGVYVKELLTPSTPRARTTPRDRADKEAANAWCGRYPENASSANRLVFAGLDFDGLRALPPAEDETGESWHDEEPSRFGRLAHRLWEPVFVDRCDADGGAA